MVLNNCIEKYGSFLSVQNCWVEVRLKVWLKQARNYALYIFYYVSFLCDPIDLLNTSDIFFTFSLFSRYSRLGVIFVRVFRKP